MGSRAAFIGSIAALLVAAPAAQAAVFTVNSTGDGGTCAGLSCPSLRAAIAAAENTREADTINVPAGVITIGSDLVVQSEMTIAGASARTTIIDGSAKARGFRVTSGGVLVLGSVTIRNGVSGGGDQADGGGIYNAGSMQLANVRVTGNRTQAGGRGGGIANYRGYLVMDNVLVDNNTADNGGGGIQNVGGPETPDRGWITATDTTIFKNTSGLGGVGGLASTANSAIVALSRVTIADNVAGSRGIGGILASGTTQVVGSTVARNLAAGETVNCGTAKPADGNFNVEDDTDCALAPGGMKPGLATALTNEGGQLDVLAITPSGDAFNRMPVGDTPCDGTDQRGTSRPQSAGCDAGAFELVVPPFVTVTSGPAGTVTANQVEFNFRADRSGVTVQCDLTGPGQAAGYETCYKENAQPYSALADGPYTFSVRAVNAQYPNATPTTRTFIVNTAPPDTTITGGPSGATNDTTPTFTFTSSEAGSTFQCRVGTAAFANCTSPHTTAVLAEGARTFEVRALDAAGVADPTPATRTFTVDATPPNTTIGSGPSGTVAATTATFTWASSETNSTFQCALDTGAFGACPVSYTGLSQGPHTFQVRATDPAGNTDTTPATRSWTVDTVAPAAPSITSAPNTPGNDNTPTFGFAGETGATFRCRVDTAAFSACTSAHTTAPLSDGAHRFEVRAVDTAGNEGSAIGFNFVVDTVVPQPPVVLQPAQNQWLSASAVTVSGTSEAGVSIEVREGQITRGTVTATANGTWSIPIAVVPDGTHTFVVTQRDRAGNTSAATNRTFGVDTGPPPTPSLSGPSGPTNDPTPTFSFTGEPGGTFRCSLDGAAPAACVSPLTTGELTDGAHTLSVFVIDGAGNQGPPSTLGFTVDTTPPAGAVTAGPDGATTDVNPAFAFTASETTTECRLDGPGGPGSYEPCASPKAFSALAPGAYEFLVRVTDPAGNQTETRRAFTVAQPQGAQPTPTPTPTTTPQPTPVPNQTIVVTPATGTVLVKAKGERAFAPLDVTKGIPNGSEVDVRKGRVTLTSVPRAGAAPETADFYGGMFVVNQKRGITDLKLSERLTGCPKGQRARASLAQKKKVTKRRLWGNGKGSFRTTGRHSSATVRGTIWLVQDTCTTTLTRVRQGVVQVNDFAKQRKTLVKKGKRYTARAKRR